MAAFGLDRLSEQLHATPFNSCFRGLIKLYQLLSFLNMQVHWPFTDQNTKELTPPYKETWQAMEELVETVC